MSSSAAATDSDGPKLKKWAKFNWEDPLLFENQLTEEEKLVRDTARQYAQDKLL
ncbi:MAG: acyl-CoA dehydrogenase, partial [Alphaproteobacteria bacterium]|nr:acyl-CoA dehydrogenase [Alphaproteobacteria bacterium]